MLWDTWIWDNAISTYYSRLIFGNINAIFNSTGYIGNYSKPNFITYRS
jgi:hypothetical protein